MKRFYTQKKAYKTNKRLFTQIFYTPKNIKLSLIQSIIQISNVSLRYFYTLKKVA